MKKLLCLLLTLAAMAALSLPASAATYTRADFAEMGIEDYDYYQRFRGQNITLDVFNWGEYVSDGADGSLDVIRAFQDLTGIRVNYTTFASNEDMYAKLQSGSSYDILVPSDYMIARLIKEGMLQKLDYSNIPNYKYIDDLYKDLECDPTNEYMVPYNWGVVGLIYNTTMTDEEITSWESLWDPKYIGNILMFSNSRDAFGIALRLCGYSMNTTDEAELAEAAQKLKEQKMLVQMYVMDEIFDKMEGGEAIIAPYYNGDAETMIAENPDLTMVYPEEGCNFFVDGFVIPKNAQHREAAEMFINFMQEPAVAMANYEYLGYSTPNTAVYEALDEETRNDPICFPPKEVINNTEVFAALPEETGEYVDRAWVDIRSYNENPNQWVGPVFLGVCFVGSIVILILRSTHAKKNRY